MSELVDLSGDEPEDQLPALPTLSAEMEIQIATAKRFPRSLDRFRKRLQGQVTLDEGIARQCHFALPRDGKTIEGPSIRFAEAVLANWGNARVATRVVAETERFVVAQAVFRDLETNVELGDEVQRRITKRDGTRFDTDMIGVVGAAARSIALRNVILRCVPKAFWWDAYVAARRTIVGDVKTMKAKRQDAIEYFKSLGVSDQQVFAALNVSGVADIGADQLVTLAGFRTSIEDEGKDPEHFFPPAETKASRTTAKPPSPAQPNPDGSTPEPVPPTQGKGAGPSGTPPPPAAPPAPPSGAASPKPQGEPAPASAPVEAFTFPDQEAARQFAADYREDLNRTDSATAVRDLKAKHQAQLNALHDLDEDLSLQLAALATDLIEAFDEDAAR